MYKMFLPEAEIGYDLLNFLFSGLIPMMETPVKMSLGFHHLLTGVSFVNANSIVMVLHSTCSTLRLRSCHIEPASSQRETARGASMIPQLQRAQPRSRWSQLAGRM